MTAVVLLWRNPPPLDGVILGVAVGGCFATLETMGTGSSRCARAAGICKA